MTLRVENLSIRYGAVEAVRDLSFTVEPGEIRANLDVTAAYLGERAVQEDA